MKAFLALTQIDLKLALRNRSVLFFNYFFPLIFFFVFGYSMHAEQGSRIIQVITMVTAIGVLGNGLFGAGMRAVQDRAHAGAEQSVSENADGGDHCDHLDDSRTLFGVHRVAEHEKENEREEVIEEQDRTVSQR